SQRDEDRGECAADREDQHQRHCHESQPFDNRAGDRAVAPDRREYARTRHWIYVKGIAASTPALQRRSPPPLHWAASGRHIEIVRALLDAGGDIDGTGDLHELGVIGWATCFHPPGAWATPADCTRACESADRAAYRFSAAIAASG